MSFEEEQATPPLAAVPPVVVHENEPPALERAEPKRPRSGGPKWEAAARERVRAGVRRFAKPLAELHARDANEGDTRLLVTDFLEHALGYDKYEDLTTEYGVRGEFADYGIRIDKQLVAFVEVKRVATKLSAKHLRQVEMYAVNEGVEWMLLTNGHVWRAYHLTGGLPVEIDLALEVDLLGEGPPAPKVQQLVYLSRESFKRRQIDELWRATRAKSPKSLADVMTSDVVTAAIAKELRRQTGQRVAPDEIAGILRANVIRPDCLD